MFIACFRLCIVLLCFTHSTDLIAGEWELWMSPDRLTYAPSPKPIEVHCHSRGVEDPKFEIHFIACEDEQQDWERCMVENAKNKLTSISTPVKTPLEVYYPFVITPEQSGILVCDGFSKEGNKSTEIYVEREFPVPTITLNRWIATAVVVVAALLMVMFIGFTWAFRRCGEGHGTPGSTIVDTGIGFLPDMYKLPREKVRLCAQIHRGDFGVYWLAKVTGVSDDASLETVVAVKEAKVPGDRIMTAMLLTELEVLVTVGQHVNVACLLGAVVEKFDQGELLLIVHYCRFGNLRDFLRQNYRFFADHVDDAVFGEAGSDDCPSSSSSSSPCYRFSKGDLLCWACQIAGGMAYLGTIGLIHRNLAARNVLLSDGSIVKIGALGVISGRNPAAWLAVESIRDQTFTVQSDVWSYGVLLWELFALGAEPYSMMLRNETILNMLMKGYRMCKPAHSGTDVYAIMKSCWQEDPSARPTFKELHTTFSNMLSISMRKRITKLYESSAVMISTRTKGTPLQNYVSVSAPRES